MHRVLISMMVALTGVTEIHASPLSDMIGEWRTVRHAALISVVDCGNGSPCGYLVRVEPDTTQGQKYDANNPAPELRQRKLDGLPVLWGYARQGDGWKNGRLYNPETGQTFRSALELVSADRLRVSGCLGPLCRTQIWTRIKTTNSEQSEGLSK